MSVVEYGNGKVGLVIGENPDGDVYVAPLTVELHKRSALSGDPGGLGLRNYPDATDRTADEAEDTPTEPAPPPHEPGAEPGPGPITVPNPPEPPQPPPDETGTPDTNP